MRPLSFLLAGLVVCAATPGYAAKEKLVEGAAEGEVTLAQADADRRRPGGAPRQQEVLPAIDASKIPPPRPNLPNETIPVPDRWRLIESAGVQSRWWDPYNQNKLKADRPLFDDYFLNLAIISDTIYEDRRIPTPVAGVSSKNAGQLDQFSDTHQSLFNENLIISVSFLQGDTVYRPPDIELRATPVLNYNRSMAEEVGVLFADPGNGRRRTEHHVGWQELFFDYHIRNVSDRFDFDSVRIGIQPIQLDFRGFLFQDQQLGVRLFGNRSNNFWQYNVGWFLRLEKDTNSGLNDIGSRVRDDDVIFVNLYRQDWPVLGFVTQGVIAHNRNREDGKFFYNDNGFLERPASMGDERPRSYDVTYFGLNGDGHFGRLNLTGSLYYAHGRDDQNQFTGDGRGADIRAWFAAAEASIDYSWIRWRLSAAYATGDDDPFDDTQTGFDAIFENPQFAGADTSFWIRQQIPYIGGGGIGLASRNAMLPALRTSKEHGQSNFNNPGLVLAGLGADFDLTPEFRISGNANYLRFDETASLEFLRNQGFIDEEIGYDLSVAAIYRPNFNQNIVFRLSGAYLLPSDGFRAIYRTRDNHEDQFFSILANLILSY